MSFQYLGLEYAPVALYKFDGTLNDTTSNAYHLTLNGGTIRYTDVAPGLTGFFFDGSTLLRHNVSNTLMRILGNLTVSVIVKSQNFSEFSGLIYFSGVSGPTSTANNTLYCLGTYLPLRSAYEDSFFTLGATHRDSIGGISDGAPTLLTWRRTGLVIDFFVNGRLIDSQALVHTPVGGASSRLLLGGLLEPTSGGTIASLKICASSLTDEQIRLEAVRSGFYAPILDVVSQSPANAATGVAINANVTFTINEWIDSAGVDIQLNGVDVVIAGAQQAGYAVSFTPDALAHTLAVVINPTSDLGYITAYTVSVDINSESFSEDWTFTTAQPVYDIIGQTPANAAIDVAINAVASFTVDFLLTSTLFDLGVTLNGGASSVVINDGVFQGAYTGTIGVSAGDTLVTVNLDSIAGLNYGDVAQFTGTITSAAFTESWSFTIDDAAPDFITQVPANAAEDIAVDTLISFVITNTNDLDSVNLDIDIDGNSSAILVAGVPQAGYTVVTTVSLYSITVEITLDEPFSSGDVVTLTGEASNTATTTTESWSFTVVVTARTGISPTEDTIKGGLAVFVYGPFAEDLALNLMQQTFDTEGSQTGASTSKKSLDGFFLTSGSATGSSIHAAMFPSAIGGDVRVKLELLTPKSLPSGVCTVAALYLRSDDGEATLRLRRSSKFPDVYAEVEVDLNNATTLISGQIFFPNTANFALQLVRHETRLFALVNGVQIFNTQNFRGSETLSVLVGIDNGTSTSTVRTKFVSAAVESHVLVDGKLLTNKVRMSSDRISGNIPATTLDRVGNREVNVFGPSEASAFDDAFEYTFGPRRSLLRNLFQLSGDTSVKD